MTLTVTNATVRYGTTVAVDAANLTLEGAEIVAVLGPSGSGKTSLLRAIAGLEPLTSGTVTWGGEDLTRVAPHQRNFGLMFQDHALFSHHDVLDNVAFGLRMRGVERGERQRRAQDMLELVGLVGFDHRRVDHLSGGERQRVALARALAPSPRLLMLDEPLASVDRERRDQLARELHRILRANGTATLLVTHDLDEAFGFADTIVILDRGRIVQTGPTRAVWRRPHTLAIARFLGVSSDIACPRASGLVTTPWGSVTTDAPGTGTTIVGFRPTDLRVNAGGAVTGRVVATWFRRDHFVVDVETAVGRLTAHSSNPEPVGSAVALAADLEAAVLVEPAPTGA